MLALCATWSSVRVLRRCEWVPGFSEEPTYYKEGVVNATTRAAALAAREMQGEYQFVDTQQPGHLCDPAEVTESARACSCYSSKQVQKSSC